MDSIPWRAESPMFYEADMRRITFLRGEGKYDPQAVEFSEAGFYRTARNIVRCFYCNGILRYSGHIRKPWEQHALWFGHCGFLYFKKGGQFIENSIIKNASKLAASNFKGIMRGFTEDDLPEFFIERHRRIFFEEYNSAIKINYRKKGKENKI